jgi:hypothetical protein
MSRAPPPTRGEGESTSRVLPETRGEGEARLVNLPKTRRGQVYGARVAADGTAETGRGA